MEGIVLQMLPQAFITLAVVGSAWGYSQARIRGLQHQVDDLKQQNVMLSQLTQKVTKIETDVGWIREGMDDIRRLTTGRTAE